MSFPTDLTEKLLQYILHNHTSLLLSATPDLPAVPAHEILALRTAIEDILLQHLEPPTPPATPPHAVMVNYDIT